MQLKVRGLTHQSSERRKQSGLRNYQERKRAKRGTNRSNPHRLSADSADPDHQEATMADEPNWDANEETDARDVEALVEQPESTDDYVSVDINVPTLFTRPRKLERCKNDLRRSFNVNAVIERPRGSNTNKVIRVEGYGIDPDSVLSCVRRYDPSASILTD